MKFYFFIRLYQHQRIRAVQAFYVILGIEDEHFLYYFAENIYLNFIRGGLQKFYHARRFTLNNRLSNDRHLVSELNSL